jgi:protocadherin Fat 4
LYCVFCREEISELTLELLALDSGTPRLTGTGTLHVIIEDINDHEPRFENDEYFLTTEENVDIGTTLDAVHAFDQDVGLNAKLR